MRLMQVFASPELVLEAPASMLMDIPGIGAQLARHISSWRSIVNPYRELELADKAGATVTTVFDASYPAALRELTDAPIVLYSWGSWTAGIPNAPSPSSVHAWPPTTAGYAPEPSLMTWRRPG